MLTIDQATYDAIVAHAEEDSPNECCGYLSARELAAPPQ